MSKKLVCVMLHEYELDEMQREGLRELCKENGYEVTFCVGKEAYDEVEDAEIIYGYESGLIKKAPNLKWFASTWAGVNTYLEEGLMKDETLLTNSSGCFGVTIGEHIVTVLLMMMRRIPEYQEIIKSGDWRNDFLIDTIYGTSIAVVGAGDIGTGFAKRAKAFEPAKIIGINRSGEKKDDVYDEVYKLSDMDRILPEVDVVVACLPGTDETVGLFTKERLALLKEGAYFVNIGRGNVLDEDAMAEALNAGRIKGAALDVFMTEPLPMDSPLRSAKNCLITPHCSGQMGAKVTRDLHFEHFTGDLKHYFKGEPLEYLVDRKKGY